MAETWSTKSAPPWQQHRQRVLNEEKPEHMPPPAHPQRRVMSRLVWEHDGEQWMPAAISRGWVATVFAPRRRPVPRWPKAGPRPGGDQVGRHRAPALADADPRIPVDSRPQGHPAVERLRRQREKVILSGNLSAREIKIAGRL